jgi:choline kinase
MVPLLGCPLLDRQMDVLKAGGIDDVSIVAGYLEHKITRNDLKKLINPDYERTNMVSSLMHARTMFDGSSDILICYGDIVYEPRVLEVMLKARHDISVAVDRGWLDLWKARMENPLMDAETMKIGESGRIVELGRKPRSLSDIQGQYVGLLKVAKGEQAEIVKVHDALDPAGSYEGRDRANMFMTTFIQILIDRGLDVGPAWIERGWLEVDSIEDLRAYEALEAKGELARLYDAR